RAACSAKARPAATSATFTERCSACRPRARISAAVASALASSSRWQKAMSAPSAAKASAVARPMPREPPVMRAVLPASFIERSGLALDGDDRPAMGAFADLLVLVVRLDLEAQLAAVDLEQLGPHRHLLALGRGAEVLDVDLEA